MLGGASLPPLPAQLSNVVHERGVSDPRSSSASLTQTPSRVAHAPRAKAVTEQTMLTVITIRSFEVCRVKNRSGAHVRNGLVQAAGTRRRCTGVRDGRRPTTYSARSLESMALIYYPVMYAAAVVGGQIVRFKLSAALTRTHRQNRGRAMTEAEPVTFAKAKRTGAATRQVNGGVRRWLGGDVFAEHRTSDLWKDGERRNEFR